MQQILSDISWQGRSLAYSLDWWTGTQLTMTHVFLCVVGGAEVVLQLRSLTKKILMTSLSLPLYRNTIPPQIFYGLIFYLLYLFFLSRDAFFFSFCTGVVGVDASHWKNVIRKQHFLAWTVTTCKTVYIMVDSHFDSEETFGFEKQLKKCDVCVISLFINWELHWQKNKIYSTFISGGCLIQTRNVWGSFLEVVTECLVNKQTSEKDMHVRWCVF